PPPQPMHLAMRAMRKVPEVTIYFWIIKLLSTAMGESTSDYLVYHINPYIAVALGSIGLIASLVLQLLVRRYVAWIYWLAVLMFVICCLVCCACSGLSAVWFKRGCCLLVCLHHDSATGRFVC